MTLLFRPRVARAIAIAAALYLSFYLWWRATSTLNPAGAAVLIFSLILLLADIQGAVSFLLQMFVTWDVHPPPAVDAPPGLSVDLYVPTYDEDLDVLEATLIGCTAIRYPHETYVLDDGRRPAVAMLAARLGCHYFTRSDTTGGKIGNINAAIPRTDGEIILVLDADTVPQPDLLDRTLGYFTDPRVALVQLPEEYYNLDSIQHEADAAAMKPWHDQALFYRVIQPGRNRWNAVTWSGGPALLRRAALEAIGGVAADTVTGDLHTSIRLHARGWKTVFHSEALAYGIAPQTLQAYTAQRARWARGAMQILGSRDNPLVVPGLSLAQRLSYLDIFARYVEPFQRLVYLVTPIVMLVTGLFPVRVAATAFLAHWFPCFTLITFARFALGRGSYSFIQVEKYNYLKMFTFLRAVLGPGRSPGASAAGRDNGRSYEPDQQVLYPNVAFLVAEAAAIVVGIANLAWRVTATYPEVGLPLMAIGWAQANLSLLALGVRLGLRRLERRHAYRFPISLTATLTVPGMSPLPAVVQDLSLYGVGLITDTPVERGRSARVTLQLPGTTLTVRGEVTNVRPLPGSHTRVGVQFILFSPEERARLVAFLFISAPRYQRRPDGMAAASAADGKPLGKPIIPFERAER
ncbi:MAG TPA: glycosyltransferase [Chloroflexota bacterium]|nr:glycosyltransferase [Chloroflexota bacterium]